MNLVADHKMLGHKVAYDSNRAPFNASGTVTGVDSISHGGCMKTETGTWGLIRFRIKPEDGSRAFWTGTFADKDRPLDEHAKASIGPHPAPVDTQP